MKTYYQPEYNRRRWDEVGFYSFMVFRSKKKAAELFPDLKIITCHEEDVVHPTFVDRRWDKLGK